VLDFNRTSAYYIYTDKLFCKLFFTWFLCAEFKKDDYTVGKDASCSYVIKDSQLNKIDYNLLAKKQFKISRKKDAVYLEDVGGTYVNEKKVGPGKKTVLNHNDHIAIAKSQLKGRYIY
jgi:pSer/pThr/pTyr-binding forkhead associated (FHA) protein